MINENNHQNASCRFAEQTVSYLYDEIGASEKSALESHLPFCTSCTDELAGFFAVRTSIREWRAEDFANLSTPVFEIPSPEKTFAQALGEWLKTISASLAPSRTWAPTVTAGFALLVVCAGLIWFVKNSSQDGNIAGNHQQVNYQIKDAPPAGNFGINSMVAAATPDQTGKITAESSKRIISQAKNNLPEDNATMPEKTVVPAAFNKIPPVSIKKPVSTRTDKNNLKPMPKTAARNNIPTLLPAAGGEEEENSLRLSDIFEEVSLK